MTATNRALPQGGVGWLHLGLGKQDAHWALMADGVEMTLFAYFSPISLLSLLSFSYFFFSFLPSSLSQHSQNMNNFISRILGLPLSGFHIRIRLIFPSFLYNISFQSIRGIFIDHSGSCME